MIVPGLIRGVELIEARDNDFLHPPVQLGVYLRLFCCLNATLLPYNNTITPYMHAGLIACNRGLCHGTYVDRVVQTTPFDPVHLRDGPGWGGRADHVSCRTRRRRQTSPSPMRTAVEAWVSAEGSGTTVPPRSSHW